MPAKERLILGISGILGLNFSGIFSVIEPFDSPSLRALSHSWSSLRGETGVRQIETVYLRGLPIQLW